MNKWKQAIVKVWYNLPENKGVFLGTAFQIGPDYLITAKHVVEDYLPNYDKIFLDGSLWDGKQSIEKPICHPNRDIAVLKLKNPLNAKCCIKLAKQKQAEIRQGQEVKFAGYSKSAPSSPIEIREEKKISYDSVFKLEVIQGSIPKGMSGSPALVNKKLVGIVVRRHHDENKTYLIRLNDFRDFIDPLSQNKVQKWLLVFIVLLAISMSIFFILTKLSSTDKLNVPNEIVDPIDGQSYSARRIGNQVWMAQNMNYAPDKGSSCYDNAQENCDHCGRLYNWETARKVCPGGWHLPSKEEWEQLINYLGGDFVAGAQIKTGGSFGLNALLCGYRHQDNTFNRLNSSGYFWSSTEKDNVYAYYYQVNDFRDDVNHGVHDKTRRLSVRCIMD